MADNASLAVYVTSKIFSKRNITAGGWNQMSFSLPRAKRLDLAMQ